jgi:hypothetical protein
MKTKMKACISIVLTTFSLSLFSPSNALAKPLTKADIEGKKICWGSSDYKVFSPGGKVYNSIVGDGTWSINKAGVITVKFPNGPFSGEVRDLGGGAIEYSGSWVGTSKLTAIGAFCN